MNTVFEKLRPRHAKYGVRTYLDDVLLFATNITEFLDLLDEVLTLLQSSGFKLSLDKCCFGVETIKFVRFILSRSGKQPNPAKVEALLRIPPPSNARALLSWAQAANFSAALFRDFLELPHPCIASLAQETLRGRPSVRLPIRPAGLP